MKFLPLLALLATAATSAFAAQPKLVVAILVDQLRYDYLERFHDQFGEGGFRLLTDQGTFMTFARYDYCPTITGPGHASFLSGAPPAMHGIIANNWFDKRSQKPVYCVGDSSVKGVGTEGKEGQMSPRNFIGANFADQMRLHFQSKVVSVSMKDRGAILPAGKKPAGAYWFEAATGHFITSTYYMAELPAWIQQFNDRNRPAEFIGQAWTRLLEPKNYLWPDDAEGEGSLPGEKTRTFDHTVKAADENDPKEKKYEPIIATPFGNQLLLELAETALEAEQLGQGDRPDLLCVSFSSVDYAGHRFGPYSQEVQDVVLRLDRQLAEFFALLDKKLGLANVEIVLTADHGSCPTPEFAAAQGFEAERVEGVSLISGLVARLNERFGAGRYLVANGLKPVFNEGNLYFNHQELRDKNIPTTELVNAIREWALDTGKFQAVFGRDQLLEGRAPGILGQRVMNGFNAERSGDVVLVYKPFVIEWGATGTTHGSPYSYDAHIPVLFHGSAFRPGRFADEFNITDIVPTLAASLHMDVPPMAIGRPFVKALKEEP